MIHIVFPENRYVSEERIILWAHDDLVNNEYAILSPQMQAED